MIFKKYTPLIWGCIIVLKIFLYILDFKPI